jgi:hypothetical protein
MVRFEILALAITKINGGLDDPDSRSFKLRNPLMLMSYRPGRPVDEEHYRIFSSFGGGFKAGIADLLSKCTGVNHRLSTSNSLRDILKVYGFVDERVQRKIMLFIQRASQDESVSLNTTLKWFYESPVVEKVEVE